MKRRIAFAKAIIKIIVVGKGKRGLVKIENPVSPENRNNRLIHLESIFPEKSFDAKTRDKLINK